MLRRISAALAAGLALFLAATPVGAAGPVTGHWARVGPADPSLFGGTTPDIFGTLAGPNGEIYIYGSFQNVCGDPTADYIVEVVPATGACHGLGSNYAGQGALLGSGGSSGVHAAAWYGGQLYAGGAFDGVEGRAGAFLAAWNGSSWHAIPGINGTVNALSVGAGKLYIGGAFDNAGEALGDYLVSWNGWTLGSFGQAGPGVGSLNGPVYDVQALADGRPLAHRGRGGRTSRACSGLEASP